MASIRVLVVDDSALVRQLLTHVLSEVPRMEVVGTARNGLEAIAAVRDLHPDVVTLDIQMPEMDGLEALKHIVRDSTARVVMLTSVDDPETTYQALEAGAIEFIGKPREGLASSIDRLGTELVRAVRIAYSVPPEKRVQRTPVEVGHRRVPEPPVSADPRHLVCIAASTGGPLALERVFSGLRTDAPAAFMVVQHLPAGFAASFATRLSRIAGFPVVEAVDGMRVKSGYGYIAPHGRHMRVAGTPGGATRIRLADGPNLHGLKPSADPLFESAAQAYGAHVTGVVLTGMGTDGAYGLFAVRNAGGQTIAQDEETSVVWGMPGAAVKLGAAQCVAPIDRVAMEVRRTLRAAGVVS
jgi:two-component system, chemotaxis family, protein-glutamate methylesterase/glutaminase